MHASHRVATSRGHSQIKFSDASASGGKCANNTAAPISDDPPRAGGEHGLLPSRGGLDQEEGAGGLALPQPERSSW